MLKIYNRLWATIFCFISIISISVLLNSAVKAMTFTTEPSIVDENVTLITAKGPIKSGDALRFQAVLDLNPPSSKVLMISSPGGNVLAAISLAKRIKANAFSVIAHEECASACAQVVFPAGVFSILTSGSMLGIHSCSVRGIRNDLCNDKIIELAMSNGFSYGTLGYFSDMYGPGEMKWMTEISARCFGYYRGSRDLKPLDGGRKACVDGVIHALGAGVEPRPFGPSFDCTKAGAKVEILFCLDKELMQSDRVLGMVYDVELQKISPKGRAVFRSKQRKWIQERNSVCEDLILNKMDFMNTRDAALCLYNYNEDRIYTFLKGQIAEF